MAIVAVRERRGYDHDYSFGQYAPNREYTRHFWVYSDTRAEDPLVVRAATGVPQPGDAHPTDVGCIVQRVKLRREEEEPKRWEVDVTYSNATRNTETEEPADIEAYIKIVVSTRQGQRLIERDRSNAILRNGAGDLIEGLTIPWNALQITITQFVLADPNYYVASMWVNAINSATWRGVPPYFAKINTLSYEPDKYEGTSCWRRTAVVDLAHVDAQPWGWRERVLNAGLREKVSGQLKAIRDDKTQLFVSKPVPLKTTGEKAGAGEENWIDLQVYPEMAFSGLGI